MTPAEERLVFVRRTTRKRVRQVGIWTALVLSIMLFGCNNGAKESADRAASDAALLSQIVDEDVAEVERGLPEGARLLAPLVAGWADPKQDVSVVRKALLRIRREAPDLDVAKSTFFALADSSGIAIRNDLEEDVMAGQNLFAIFPALVEANRGLVMTTGAFPNAQTTGPDKDWVAGFPVKRPDGSTAALLVTGWSYRYFARHLQEALKTRLMTQAKKAGTPLRLPVFYVAVFDRTGVYPAPLTPAVDEQALLSQGLSEKTIKGPYEATLTITGVGFGMAARRTPTLAPDTGIVVLQSEL
jgi:hypothetical protein